MKETRNLLVDAILDLSGDEFETKEDVKRLAKEDIDELVMRLINIAEWYRSECYER
jgi:two-component SAPR family response regulator